MREASMRFLAIPSYCFHASTGVRALELVLRYTTRYFPGDASCWTPIDHKNMGKTTRANCEWSTKRAPLAKGELRSMAITRRKGATAKSPCRLGMWATFPNNPCVSHQPCS